MMRPPSHGAVCASPTRFSRTVPWRLRRHSGQRLPARAPRVTTRPRGALGPNGSACQYHEPAVPDNRPPFEDLYRDYLGRIYAYVRAQVPTSADAEDITAQ